MTEAEKTQGPLFKPKKNKADNRKSMTVSEQSQALVPRKAFKEEAARPDDRVAVVDAPPRAPSPPPPPKSLPAPAVNVFDFLVTDGKDGPSAAASPNADEEWDMTDDDEEEWEDADDVFMELPPDYDTVEEQMYNARRQLEADALAASTDPLVPPVPNPMAYFVGIDTDVRTPVVGSKSHSRNISTDSTAKKSGKRKRSQPEELDLSNLRGYPPGGDVVMTDVPPTLHSGLTGGIQKMMMHRPGFPFPPSPDDSNGDGADPLPPSPLKRSRRAKHEKKERGRSRDAKDGTKHDGAQRSHKKSRRTSDESRRTGHWERRRRRADSPSHDKDKPDPPKTLLGKALKAIEYHPTASSSSLSKKEDAAARATASNAVILHPERASPAGRAALFMRFAEGAAADADRGCSVHKALRRFHRERGDKAARAADEKELWRDLRLRINDRGEVVLFVG